MPRFARGTCCAVVVALGLAFAAQASAQEAADSPFFESGKKASPQSAEERIEAVLDMPLKTPLDFTELPLIEIINTLQEEYNLPIVFDHAALDEVAISPETEITVNLRNITLRSALNLMFRQSGVEDLTYVIDDEVLLITTQDQANNTLLVRMYRVDDLDLFGDAPSAEATRPKRFSSLAEAITTCVCQDCWQVNGKGEGELVLLKPGILVVISTRRIQEEVQEFLDQLRRVKAGIDGESERTSRF